MLGVALRRGRAQVMFLDNICATASHKARTHGPGWHTAHASSIDEKGRIVYPQGNFRPALCGYYWYIYIYVVCIYIYLYGFDFQLCRTNKIVDLANSDVIFNKNGLPQHLTHRGTIPPGLL